jgi:hypothetical protein
MHKIEPGPQIAPELDAEQMVAITMEAAGASCRALRAGSMATPNNSLQRSRACVVARTRELCALCRARTGPSRQA